MKSHFAGNDEARMIHAKHTERYCHPCQHLRFVNAVYGPDFARGGYKCMHPEAHDLGATHPTPKRRGLPLKLMP